MSYWLAKSGNVKALGALVDVGVNVMNAGPGNDALTAAFDSANLDTFSFLIDKGLVNIHAPISADGQTTAIHAATFNSDEIQCNIFPHLVAKDPTTFEKVYGYLIRERQDTSKDWIIKNNLRRVVDLLPAEKRTAANEMIARLQEA